MTDEVKPDFNKTRAELMKENAALRAQLEVPPAGSDEVSTLKAQLAELQTLQADRAGWLITTRNLLYDGTTHGVKFDAGMAFIPVNAKFPKYRQAPPKDTYREMHKISDQAWATMLARAKRTDAEVVVELLTKDMRGYQAKFFAAEQQRDLQQFQEQRRLDFQDALARVNDSSSRALTTPGFVGA